MSVRFRRDTLPHRSSVSCPARCSVFGYDQLTITSLFCLALIMQTTPLSTRTPVYAFLRAVLPLERRKKTIALVRQRLRFPVSQPNLRRQEPGRCPTTFSPLEEALKTGVTLPTGN
jgi:hypothetical protein